jgi:hypothetical protein
VGNLSALLQALKYCAEIDTCPEWLYYGFKAVFTTAMNDAAGPLAKWQKKHDKDLIDFVRYSSMMSAREHGLTWSEAASFTAEYFAPTPAGGGTADAVRKSYADVKKRTGVTQPLRYYITDDVNLRMARLDPPPAHGNAVFSKWRATIDKRQAAQERKRSKIVPKTRAK